MMSNLTGWNRTFALALGAAIGVVMVALIIHYSKVGWPTVS